MNNKKRCSRCGGLDIKLNGKYSNKKQRFYCYECKRSFSWNNKKVKRSNEFVWFKKWLIGGYLIRQIIDISGKSEKKIRTIINRCLDSPPKDKECDYSKIKYTIFDASYIWKRKLQITALLDGVTNRLVDGRYDLKENSSFRISSYFFELRNNGFDPKTLTVDGNTAVIKAAKHVWPNIIIQRCLVHIQRQGLMWCRINPKTTDAKKLRKLFAEITNINDVKSKKIFIEKLMVWEEKYGNKISRGKERGWVFSDLKRARSMILKSLPDMFHYLEDKNIPRTSNAAEGFFKLAKDRYKIHQGLAREKKKNFFLWFFYFRKQ